MLCRTDPGHKPACPSDAKTLLQAKIEAGQVHLHCSVIKSHPLSEHKARACWIRPQAPPRPTLSLLLVGGSALRRLLLYHPLPKSCLICAGTGEQGCPAYQRSVDYQGLISLLGDKRHLAEGF